MTRLACLVWILLAACAPERPSAGPPSEASTQEAPPDATGGAPASALPEGCQGLERSLLQTAPTRAELRARFGEPDSIAAVTVPNRHVEGVTDTLFTVHYPALIVSIHTPGGGDDLPSSVQVDDNRYVAFPRIGIGAAADSVIAALGEPTRRDPDGLVYDCGEVEQPVRFELADGRVRRIAIAYYVD